MLRTYTAAVLWYYPVWCLTGSDTVTYITWEPWRTPVVPLAWRAFTFLPPEPLLWISLAQVFVAGLVPLGALLLLVMKPRLGWLCLATAGYYLGVGALVAGTSRFRIPVEPFMGLCAGFTTSQALTGFKNRCKISWRKP
jgi:hypothetical protein